MFYKFSQNNSGGSFIVNEQVGQYVIIEADNYNEANRLAQEKAHIYFDGCEDGTDCNCCGDRWYSTYDDGDEVPMIYDKTVEEFQEDPGIPSITKEISIHIYYKDGRHENIVFDAAAAAEKKEAQRRKKVNKLWGNIVTLRDIRWKNPNRYYESEHKDEHNRTIYYDKTRNRSIVEGININYGFGYITFASENKKEVEDFVAGAGKILDIVKKRALKVSRPPGKTGEGMKAMVKLLTGDREL